MVYGFDAMILVEIDSPTWRRMYFDEGTNKEGLDDKVISVETKNQRLHPIVYTFKINIHLYKFYLL